MADAKPGFGRAVLLPTLLVGAGLGVLGLFLSTFLGDRGALTTGLIAAWVAYSAGRALGHADRPQGFGAFLQLLLAGTALGFVGATVLNALFLEGPGWPWTPWWVLMGGFGIGLYRAHKALLRQARATEADAPRWLGVFHPKDIQALAVLMGGYALVGLAGLLVLRAFSGLIPGMGQFVTIAVAIYALHGARLLLGFASEERAQRGKGALGWIKANALQNAIVVLVLIAYLVFRDDLARSVPFYPLVEFGLGIAVFSFVLARLRSRLRRDGSILATASEARDHERILSELREADYDEVARPVTRFIESGLGANEYANTVRASAGLDDAATERALAPLRAHREPLRPPPIELEWSLAAGATMTMGLGIAAFALGYVLFEAPMPYPLLLMLLFLAFGAYAQQDAARAHHRPWLALGIAIAGTAVLFLDFLFFVVQNARLADVPGIVWGIVGGIAAAMIGFPALASWRLDKRIREGQAIDARRLAPALEMQRDLQATRKRASAMTIAAFVILLPVPWLAGWLGGRGIIPGDFPEFLDKLLAVVIWVLAAFGASAIVRFYGLTRARPKLLAREKAKRDRRIDVHRTIMQSIEKV